MLQINTLSFSLLLEKVEKESGYLFTGPGNYVIELSGESPFDTRITFSERFLCNSEGLPFFRLEDATRFGCEMAAFWKSRLEAYPKLAVTSIGEMADAWQKFAAELEDFQAAGGVLSYAFHTGYE
jgi:hypothetical protein